MGKKSRSIYPCIVFTDVVGSSKQWTSDPVRMHKKLSVHFNRVERLSAKHDGMIVKTIGDAFMVYFASENGNALHQAVQFAVDLITEETFGLRVGICSGEVVQRPFKIQDCNMVDFFGTTVNIASRMESKVAGKAGHVAIGVLSQNTAALEYLDTLCQEWPAEAYIYVADKELASCQDDVKTQRSMRLLTCMQHAECRKVETLKGVPDLLAFRFRVK